LIKIVRFLVGSAFYIFFLVLAGLLFDVRPTFVEGFVVTIVALLSRDFEEWFERKMKS